MTKDQNTKHEISLEYDQILHLQVQPVGQTPLPICSLFPAIFMVSFLFF